MKKVMTMVVTGVMALVVGQGCYKAVTVTVDNSPAITKTVSFSNDMIPVFVKNCALSGCHSAGGQAPDLSAANAFNSLAAGNYLSKAMPAKSELYLWLTGKESQTMPLGFSNNPSNINALTLAWITQGAKNN